MKCILLILVAVTLNLSNLHAKGCVDKEGKDISGHENVEIFQKLIEEETSCMTAVNLANYCFLGSKMLDFGTVAAAKSVCEKEYAASAPGETATTKDKKFRKKLNRYLKIMNNVCINIYEEIRNSFIKHLNDEEMGEEFSSANQVVMTGELDSRELFCELNALEWINDLATSKADF